MTDVQTQIKELVTDREVLLFMKGDRQTPQCGFSATVIEILDDYLPDYGTLNVLADSDVREGIKEYSDWPTIPQLYVKGEFVGGCDIIRELHETGELAEVLGSALIEIAAPDVTLSDAAIKAFLDAREGEEHQDLRLEVTGQFQYALSFGPELKGDLVLDLTSEQGSLKLRLDRGSARRAHGMSIDFVAGPDGAGFKIENPNEPPKIQNISPKELKAKLDDGSLKHFYDVRPDAERALAKLESAPQLTDEIMATLEHLDKSTPIAFHCKSGGRSQAAAQQFLQVGFQEVYNLAGGINAWSKDVDEDIPLY